MSIFQNDKTFSRPVMWGITAFFIAIHIFAVVGRMWIAFFIRILVMHAVRRNPRNRPAFNRQRAARRQYVFHPFRSLVSAMRQQTVIAHPDAEAPAHPIRNHRENETGP